MRVHENGSGNIGLHPEGGNVGEHFYPWRFYPVLKNLIKLVDGEELTEDDMNSVQEYSKGLSSFTFTRMEEDDTVRLYLYSHGLTLDKEDMEETITNLLVYKKQILGKP